MPASRPGSTPASSRAIGKQPMAYPSPTPPSPRTARAASKAPLPPHAYPHTHHHPSPPSSAGHTNPRQPAGQPPAAAPPKPNKIWSTSTTEERERIKDFWLGLGEEERRNLVKVEKDTVLRKMKEQQKHSCSCAVCGRKRFVFCFFSLLNVIREPSLTECHLVFFRLGFFFSLPSKTIQLFSSSNRGDGAK